MNCLLGLREFRIDSGVVTEHVEGRNCEDNGTRCCRLLLLCDGDGRGNEPWISIWRRAARLPRRAGRRHLSPGVKLRPGYSVRSTILAAELVSIELGVLSSSPFLNIHCCEAGVRAGGGRFLPL